METAQDSKYYKSQYDKWHFAYYVASVVLLSGGTFAGFSVANQEFKAAGFAIAACFCSAYISIISRFRIENVRREATKHNVRLEELIKL